MNIHRLGLSGLGGLAGELVPIAWEPLIRPDGLQGSQLHEQLLRGGLSRSSQVLASG